MTANGQDSDDDDDYLRWCVYCGADCGIPHQRHQAHCPTVTGLFPVDADDVAMRLGCVDCGTLFRAGDSYMERDLKQQDTSTAITLMVCIDCGRTAAGARERP